MTMSDEDLKSSQDSNIETDKTVDNEGSELNIDEVEDVEELRKIAKTYKAQKGHFKHKFESLSKQEIKPVVKPETQPNKVDNDRLDKIDLVITHKELEKPDVEFLSALAKGMNISLEEAYNSEGGKIYLSAVALKKKTANAGVDGSRSPKNKIDPNELPKTLAEHEAWAKKNFGLR